MRPLRKLLLSGLLFFALFLSAACTRGPGPQRLDKVQIELGGRKLAV